MPAHTLPPGLAQTFGLIISGLCQAVARRSAAHRADGPLLVLVWGRLSRLAQKFAALAARAQAGPLPPPRPSRPHRSAGKTPPRARQPDLPRGLAWLIRLVPGTAQYGGQVQHLLSQPEMTALLQAAPQAGRIVRPLCRMLAIPLPPALRLPPRPAKPRPAKPRPPSQSPPDSPPGPDPEMAAASGPQPDPGPASGEQTGNVYVWRRWRGILMPEPVRPLKPA